jgi:3-deoxy-7-phosphoheptulonate synthase
MIDWSPSSWRNKTVHQHPEYMNPRELQEAENTIGKFPPLVFAEEIRALKSQLAQVAEGKAFLLQGGDCAESYRDFSATNIREMFKIFMQMAIVLTYAGRFPVVKVGRIAGQFAKPRSSATEQLDGLSLPSYRGDIVNDIKFSKAAREPDPNRMVQAYHQSAATQNLLRAFATGGYADLHKVNQWNQSFLENNPLREKYEQLATNIQDALAFMEVIGITSHNTPALHQTTLYTSHEALLLHYEEPLVRKDSLTGLLYGCSAHMLWIGERTRQLDGAHIEFFRGLQNPVGIKLGPGITPEETVQLIDALNPHNEAGRLTLITRMGSDKIQQILPAIVRRVRDEGRQVVWSCDPMHGNTVKANNGYKTRSFDRILQEILLFFGILRAENAHPGGIHLEMTGAHVTECTGGAYKLSESDLHDQYLTQCDPRLNADQGLELAFRIAEFLHKT